MRSWRAGLAGGIVAAWALSAQALINPNFTPRNLVTESKLIAAVTLELKGTNMCSGAVQEFLKGSAAGKTISFDLSQALNPEMRKHIAGLVKASGKTPGLFFLGMFSDTGQAGVEGGEAGGEGEAKAFLHVSGTWIDLSGGGEGAAWGTIQNNVHMEGTWAGSTDMLLRAVKYILSDDTADFPVVSGSQWQQAVRAATVEGLRRVRPVDLDGNGKWALFAAAAKGDRLYRGDAKAGALRDVTAELKLASASERFAWGDYDGDGALDLASHDGKSLSVFLRQKDGGFQARAVGLKGGEAAGCRDLAALAAGPGGKAGLLISGAGGRLLVRDLTADAPAAESMPEGAGPAADMGKAGPSLVADFDGDGLADCVSLFEKGSLFYKGKAVGQFLPSARCEPCMGPGESEACTGDYDGDGRFDILCVAEDGFRIWQNEGGGHFADFGGVSGEIVYIAKPGGVDCATCDVNNDGRQDIFIAYAEMSPHVFFNRGFRSYGHAHDLDVEEQQLLAEAGSGQKTGCVGDFNGDGAQDMVLGLKNGEIWMFPRSVEDEQALCATAALPAAGGYRGPVAVTGWSGSRCLGAWNVLPGVSEAFFGTREAGPMVLKWRMPGGEEQKKAVVVESAPVRVVVQ